MTRKHWTLLALLFTAALPAVAHAAFELGGCCDDCGGTCGCSCCE